MTESNPPDPHLIHARLAEGRTASTFKVFADLTNGPGWRARVVEYSAIVLGFLIAGVGMHTLSDALQLVLPGVSVRSVSPGAK